MRDQSVQRKRSAPSWLNLQAFPKAEQLRERLAPFPELALSTFERLRASTAIPLIGVAQNLEAPSAVREALPRKAGHLGIICDLDQTIIPPHDGDRIPDPFPGISELIHILGESNTHYVTGRPPEHATHIPKWLESHGLPLSGSFNTGTPNATDAKAAARKTAQISAILSQDPTRSYVLFGDSSHVDADVYRRILRKFPHQVVAAFIRQVPDEAPATELGGLEVIKNYAQAAQILEDLGVIDKTQSNTVAHASIA